MISGLLAATRGVCLSCCLLVFLCWTQLVFADDPLVFKRDGHCPPIPLPAKPVEGKDLFTPGTPPTIEAWLVYRYHWDDGKGNDLTVDSVCVTAGEYMSVV